MNTESKSPFGFDFLNIKEKTQKVLNVFSSVSSSYDLMNDLMSAGAHRLWKKEFVNGLPLRPNLKILDLATGTGDIAIKIAKKCKLLDFQFEITAVDPNENMIRQGESKAYDCGILDPISWVIAPAETLPFDDATFDICTISFGLRNTSDIDQALKEIKRVLKPGGYFGCLEFSHPKSSAVQIPYEFYSFSIIPTMGQIITGNKEAYQYLVESIRTFPNQDALIEKFKNTGFVSNSYENILNGIVAIHKGWA